jgi:hypothetical protein
MALDPNLSTQTKLTKAYSPKETKSSTHLGPLQLMQHNEVQNKTKIDSSMKPYFYFAISCASPFMGPLFLVIGNRGMKAGVVQPSD